MSATPCRLKHLNNYRDIARDAAFVPYPSETWRRLRIAGRYVYRVRKNDSGRMSYIFAIGNHVADVRDLAHLYCPEMLKHMGYFDLSEYVIRYVFEKAEPHLKFPRWVTVR